MPFRYQGQYYDFETNLAYNRFRYYCPETGAYISQDPIGLAGGNPTIYGYVEDTNTWVDVFGLNKKYSCVNKKNKKKNKKLLKDLDERLYRSAIYTNDASRGALLPKSRKGKKITYTEHDIQDIPNANNGANRGVKRLVKGSDGRVYYTNSHYQSFIRIR